ncbi:hypothetical protein [Corynebacterium guangdongense]|uniref:Secreted protein n=1 Tax=Corynebacterium guangdongense TaxID=1783348 RepID=A0ABU2A050_9CORY|nr:hypothetical protein [Corynebacterium guangdongense]MDR7330562.1 hypothetical protein [Corynebacterium guangdongense]WJZ19116.1 hypothetical protein CGUA_12945 [Corynebacterium guangdongense]
MNITSISALTLNGLRGRTMIAAGAATVLAASTLIAPTALAQDLSADLEFNSAEELSSAELGSSTANGRTITVDEGGDLNIDTALAAELADLLRAGVRVSLEADDGTRTELSLDGDTIVVVGPEDLPAGTYTVRVGAPGSAELSSGSSELEDTTPGSGEGSADELASSALAGSSLSSLGGLAVVSSAAELSSGSSDGTDENDNGGSGNGTSEGSSGSSSSEDGIPENCVAAGLTVGIPLALLVPVAVGNQVGIPGLESMSAQVNLAIQDMNTQVQQGLGVYSDQAAAVAEQFNINVGTSSGDAARIAGSAAALAVAAAAGYYLYESCTP